MSYLLTLAGDWLATYAFHSTVFLLAALGLTAVLPRRHSLYADAVLKIAVLLPLVSSLAATSAARWTTAAEVVVVRQPEVLSIGARASVGIVGAAVMLWLFVAALRLRSLRVLYRRHLLDLGPRRTLSGIRVNDAFTSRSGDVTVTAAERCLVPLAMHREVCLPARALRELTADQLRSILAHELAHIERRDPFWRATIACVTELFFFQPLNRLAASRIRDLSEWICDARSLHQRGGGSALAAALACVAEWAHDAPRPRFAASLLHDESLTLRRVRAALGPPDAMLPVRTHQVALGVSTAIALAMFMPAAGLDVTGNLPYTVRAYDDAGPFTVTLRRGAVLGVSVGETTLAPHMIDQRGRTVAIMAPASEPLQLSLTPRGGFTWQSRRAPAQPSPIP